jgi:5-methylcytosine-specific restriction endonuclease McrA
MSNRALIRLRFLAHQSQFGLCHYCSIPMWIDDQRTYSLRYGISMKAARQFKCTAEHLLPRQDGGKDVSNNIVAACLHCNKLRHARKSAPPPEQYAKLVRDRLAHKRWHPEWVFRTPGFYCSARSV